MKCIKCGSFAINENSYERVKGEHSNLYLCDPHYWQEQHAQLQAEVEALRKCAEWQPITADDVTDEMVTSVCSTINRRVGGWGSVQPRELLAAAVNAYMGAKK